MPPGKSKNCDEAAGAEIGILSIGAAASQPLAADGGQRGDEPPRLKQHVRLIRLQILHMNYRVVVSEQKVPSSKWPSISFTIRRPNKRALRLTQPAGCPLVVADPKRHLFVRVAVGMWPGVWPHFSVLVQNCSSQPVHSYVVRFAARPAKYSSGILIQPEDGLSADGQLRCSTQEPDSGCMAVCIDFVQFTSGEVWCSTHHDALVTGASVKAGATAAADYLLGVLERSDGATVMAGLTHIHANVESGFDSADGGIGFRAGVTSVAVRLRRACEENGLSDIENCLRAVRA